MEQADTPGGEFMMRIVMLAASVIACSSSNAQITAILNPLPDGSTEIRIRNDASMALVALAISLKATNGVFDVPLVVYSDPTVDAADAPLLPSREHPVKEARRFVMRGGNQVFANFEQPIVTAGIFSDGSTTGDSALLSRLLLRRSNMLLAVETALEILLGAGSRNVPRAQLIGQFREMAESMNRWYVPPEQQVGRALYQSIAGKLMNLPKEPVGSPFPSSAFVRQQSASLNQHRVALLESQPSLANAFQISTR